MLEKARKTRLVNDNKGNLKKEYQSISYRFVRKDGNWYINATTEEAYPKVTTSKWNGAIGVDINDGFLVAGEVDRYGNPLQEIKIPVPMHDRSSHQITAAIGDAVKQIVHLAKTKGKPIVIENLDFGQKKQSLGESSAKYSRMLSGFTYAKFNQIATSQCAREGAGLISRNPFATLTTTEGKRRETMLMVLVQNGLAGGGFKRIAPRASCIDSRFDVVGFRAIPWLKMWPLLRQVLRGEHVKDPAVLYFQTDRIELTSNLTLATTMDGERGPDLPLTATVHPRSLLLVSLKNARSLVPSVHAF